MANFKAHTTFNLLLALPICLAGIAYFFSPPFYSLAIFSGAFTYGTLFMSPDMDLAHRIKLFSIRGFLTLPFRSYALVFRHRGISHSFLFGTMTRILWLLFITLIAIYLYRRSLPSYNTLHQILSINFDYITWGFFGLFCADAGHLFMDK
jgi:uncharacterized metal-binding protein